MKLFEGKSPSERNKIVAAIGLGLISLAAIVYVFFGDSLSSASPPPTAGGKATPSPRPGAPTTSGGPTLAVVDPTAQNPASWTPVSYSQPTPPDPAVGRNIFSFFEPPPPMPKVTPTPKLADPPKMLLSSVSPANVFARTSDFTLQATGDKFTPDSRITFDGNALPTKFISAQQLQAPVSAAMIANDGARMIKVISGDPKVFSNDVTLVVAAPPRPNYDYVALIGDRHYQNDVAMLKSKSDAKVLISVQRGDLVAGRFRVTSISETEVAMVDTSLNIKHTIPFSTDKTGGGPGGPGSKGGPESGNDIRRMPAGRMQQQPDQGTSIPGIPDSIPRYQPPGQPNKGDVDDDDDGKP